MTKIAPRGGFMTETVTISADEYRYLLNLKRNIEDARAVALVMADISVGAPALTEAEMDAYLAAPTPLAFWRKRAGKTQTVLAAEIGVSQPFLAQIEAGKRDGTVGVLARIAAALQVRIEDLVTE